MSVRDFGWQTAIAAIGHRWGGNCLAAGLVAVAVGGCAALGGGLTKDTPAAAKEAAVAERANARWQALIKRDYEGAYQYLSPASRETTSVSQFQTKIAAIQYRAVTVDKVECAAEVCKVKLSLTYDYPPAKAKGVVTLIDESWIIDQGQAWFAYRG
jgi:hypothetical protein